MRADAYLRLAQALPEVELGELTRDRGIVVVAPHPDDESLGCGGLIAAGCARGAAVRLVVLSDGAASHPGSRRYPAARLRALREAELEQAASILGLPESAIARLYLRDGAVPDGGPDFDRAVAAVRAAAIETAAAAVFVTWRHDPHCDHRAAFAIARAAVVGLDGARLYAYPIWGWSLPPETILDEDEPKGAKLAIGLYLDQKRRAIHAHVSQTTALIDDDPAGFRLEPEVLARFDRPHEIFLECAP